MGSSSEKNFLDASTLPIDLRFLRTPADISCVVTSTRSSHFDIRAVPSKQVVKSFVCFLLPHPDHSLSYTNGVRKEEFATLSSRPHGGS